MAIVVIVVVVRNNHSSSIAALRVVAKVRTWLIVDGIWVALIQVAVTVGSSLVCCG